MSENVVSLAQFSNNGSIRTVDQTLLQALEYRETPEDVEIIGTANKVMVVFLDDADGGYRVSWMQGGMRLSECISLLRVAEVTLLKSMNILE